LSAEILEDLEVRVTVAVSH